MIRKATIIFIQEPLVEELPHLCSQVKTAQFYKLLKSKIDSTSCHKKLNESKEYQNKSEKINVEAPNKDKNEVLEPNELGNANERADAVSLDLSFAETLHDIKFPSKVKAPNFQTCSDAKAYLNCPYYEIYVNENAGPIKLPLETLPRSGMLKSDVLLFSNGRKTVIMDPFLRHYFCGVQSHETIKNEDNNAQDVDIIPGVDQNMPIMKNAEIYAAKNGTVYLIGGKYDVKIFVSSSPSLVSF